MNRETAIFTGRLGLLMLTTSLLPQPENNLLQTPIGILS